jgi:hypothetical protein
MLPSLIISTLGAVIVCATVASAQTLPQTQPDAQQAQQAFENLPWAVRLGIRSQQLTDAFPVVDRVVLVPDAATYLDELAKWSPTGGRWPVLIEDNHFAPMFVRRFAPKQLIRRESVGIGVPNDVATRQRAIEDVIVKSFGGDPAQHTWRELFAQHRYSPPGVVISSVEDPAWTAAVALAAGRGQALAWLDGNFGEPHLPLDQQSTARLIQSVHDLVAKQNYSFDALGDQIDAITICRSIATSANHQLPGLQPPGIPAAQSAGPLAVTDLVGRKPDGARFAYTGWIFGDEVRCAYMAMCSLFLLRGQETLYNTYPSDNIWGSYGMADAIGVLREAGYQITDVNGESANEQAWQRMLMGGVATDLFVMNTKGNSDFFDLFSGRGWFTDVPTLNTPCALHLIHSWSMQAPNRLDTVGGQWLDAGAYAAVGSCYEPMLTAFVPPNVLAKRIMSYVPLLIAARWWDGEPGIAQPWRVVTIGDPLMICPPPAQSKKQRVEKSADYGIDLNERVKSLMREAASPNADGRAAAEAIAILNMLGKDQVAAQIWKLAQQHGKAERASRSALDVFFRLRDLDAFLQAWDLTSKRDEHAVDMLWHLGFARLNPGGLGPNRDLLLQLEVAIRPNAVLLDLTRLAPHLMRAFGGPHVRQSIERHMSKADPALRQQLQELMRQY